MTAEWERLRANVLIEQGNVLHFLVRRATAYARNIEAVYGKGDGGVRPDDVREAVYVLISNFIVNIAVNCNETIFFGGKGDIPSLR